MSSNDYEGTVHDSREQSSMGFQPINISMQPLYSQLNLFGSEEDFLSEEEIRMKSNLMLEQEDIQQMLNSFTSGGNFSMPQDDAFSFPTIDQTQSPSSNCSSYDEDCNRPAKPVVSWLKIKAAMRWGFFVRKKAAETRATKAQLVELDDDENEIS
ncbi:hypothetical protein QQ045_023406 [Rhodiola kirilowii]